MFYPNSNGSLLIGLTLSCRYLTEIAVVEQKGNMSTIRTRVEHIDRFYATKMISILYKTTTTY